MKILLADDHSLFREGVARLLAGAEGIELVGEAATVGEAVDLALACKPDLILTEVRFEDGDVLNTLEMILPLLPQTAVVVLTGVEDDVVLMRTVRAGARGYLLKTIAFTNLVQALRGVLRGEPALSRTAMGKIMDDFARIDAVPPSVPSVVSALTGREVEVLRLLARGDDNQELADSLSISKNTVRVHVHNILDKLNLKNRHEAGEFARRLGFDQ